MSTVDDEKDETMVGGGRSATAGSSKVQGRSSCRMMGCWLRAERYKDLWAGETPQFQSGA